MQATDTNVNFHVCKMDNSENYYSPTETDDDAYWITQDWHRKPKRSRDMIVLREMKENKVKTCISALGLLIMLGALMALCVVGSMNQNTVRKIEILREQYENATAELMIQENKAKEKERMYEVLEEKYQELDFVCSQKIENSTSAQCEEGWKSFGLKCYYFSKTKLNWTESRDYCVEKGSHLVIITSQTEQMFVSLHTSETSWIGLNDLETEGQWMWVNNQPLTETGAIFWYSTPEGPNEPDNWKGEDPSGENCAALGHEIGSTHKWFDASCRKRKQFICEK